MIGVNSSIVGRSAEFDAYDQLPDPDGGLRVLAFVGEPGVGKTAVLEALVKNATSSGTRLLSCRASPSDTKLSFSGLVDLLRSTTTNYQVCPHLSAERWTRRFCGRTVHLN
jgi:predicted ATPase